MIIGIGCDLVSHDFTKTLEWESDKNMLQKIFTQREMQLYEEKNRISFIAGRFAAKEAVLKSLGTGMEDGISLLDIEILMYRTGCPEIKVKGRVKEIADGLGVSNWKLSISHSDKTSMAFVLAQ